MLTDLSEIIRNAGIAMMAVAVLALVTAVIFREARGERRSIFIQALITALLLWYISWLIG